MEKTWKNIEKSEENMEKTLGKYGKIRKYGKILGKYGKILEK